MLSEKSNGDGLNKTRNLRNVHLVSKINWDFGPVVIRTRNTLSTYVRLKKTSTFYVLTLRQALCLLVRLCTLVSRTGGENGPTRGLCGGYRWEILLTLPFFILFRNLRNEPTCIIVCPIWLTRELRSLDTFKIWKYSNLYQLKPITLRLITGRNPLNLGIFKRTGTYDIYDYEGDTTSVLYIYIYKSTLYTKMSDSTKCKDIFHSL